MRQRTTSTILLALLLCTGCDEGILGFSEGDARDAIACTADVRPGIVVEVVDAIGASPVLTGVTVTLRDGAYSETLTQPWINRFSGAWERPGTYVVKASKEGFADWSRSGVQVTADVCHVKTVTLNAVLAPTAGR